MTVILAEKPMSARKLESVTGVKTVSLVGHLLGLKKQDRSWTPPYFRIKWVPKRNATQKLESIAEVLSGSEDIVVATDYDAEGQLIALNVLRYANIDPRSNRVRRMRFSSLESDELINAYENTIEFDMDFAMMAEVRHYLDWYFGINMSKVITVLRDAKRFRLTPVGRVQSPVLKYLAEREKEIGAFVNKKVWYADVYGVYGEWDNKTFRVVSLSFDNKDDAEHFMESCLTGEVATKETHHYEIMSYPPNTEWIMKFGLGMGISANIIEKILQDLYLNEYISYPRTNSTQYLSHGVYTRRYLERLIGVVDGAEDALEQVPNEGEESDIHPAIYPIKAYHETDLRGVIWTEIAENFVKCHLPPEQSSSETCIIDIGGKLYQSREIPDIDEGEKFDLTYNLKEGNLSPPRRYKQSDVYNWMTEANIGTRDTRSQIVTKVLKYYAYETRGGIYIGSLGMNIANVLSKFSPDLVSTNLTKTFEKQITEVGNGGSTETTLIEGRKVVTELVNLIMAHGEEVHGML